MKLSISSLSISLLSIYGLSNAAFAQTNLIANGDFESGNLNFQSQYNYWAPGTNGNMGEGTYSVITNLSQVHNEWARLGSLSAQSGTNYFVGNGSANTNFSPWMQTVSINAEDIALTISPDAPVYYRFQAYIASVYPLAAQPSLAFEMSFNNSGLWQELTTSVAPATNQAYLWLLTYRDGFFESAPTNLSFRLRNAEAAFTGNDFAIDNIYFGLTTNAPGYSSDLTPIDSIGVITGVPEPSTVSLLLLGFVFAAYIMHRRRKIVSPQ